MDRDCLTNLNKEEMQCQEKKKYYNEAHAIQGMHKKLQRGIQSRYYNCPICKNYHLTTKLNENQKTKPKKVNEKGMENL